MQKSTIPKRSLRSHGTLQHSNHHIQSHKSTSLTSRRRISAQKRNYGTEQRNGVKNTHSFSSTNNNNNNSNQTYNTHPPSHQKGTPSRPNNIKLSKTQIDHLKSLQSPTGRAQSGSFLVEGRKLIEALSLEKIENSSHLTKTPDPSFEKSTFVKPRTVFLTAEQYDKIEALVDTSRSITRQNVAMGIRDRKLGQEGDENGPKNGNNDKTVQKNEKSDPNDPNDLESLLSSYRQSSFLVKSTQHSWPVRPDGTLIPPSSHSLDKTMELSDVQMQLYQHILKKGFVVESALLGRLSQFSNGPGIIAEFNSLNNINQFEYSFNSDDDMGTIDEPRFGGVNGISFSINNDDNEHDNNTSNLFNQKNQSTTKTHNNLSPAPQSNWDWSKGGLILSGISDPGNLGTIIRSAHGFGVEQIVVMDGCDLYNGKTISSSSGAISHIKSIISCTGTQFIDFMRRAQAKDKGIWGSIKSNGLNNDQNGQNGLNNSILSTQFTQPYLVGLTPNRGLDLDNIPPSLNHHIINQLTGSSKDTKHNQHHQPKNSNINSPWLVVGSEAFGLPSQIEELLHCVATIPTKTDFVDSLNASVAASIGLYVIKQ